MPIEASLKIIQNYLDKNQDRRTATLIEKYVVPNVTASLPFTILLAGADNFEQRISGILPSNTNLNFSMADPSSIWPDAVLIALTTDTLPLMADEVAAYFAAIGPRKVILVYKIEKSVTEEKAIQRLRDFSKKIFGPQDESALPVGVLASYLVSESNEMLEPEPIPVLGAPAFDDLFVDFPTQAVRLKGLEASIHLATQRATELVRNNQIQNEEIAIFRKSMDLLLIDSIHDAVEGLPHSQLGRELEYVWHNQARGLPRLGQIFGTPLRRLFGRTYLDLDNDGIKEIKNYLESVVERVFSEYLGSLDSNKILVYKDSDEFVQLKNVIRDYQLERVGQHSPKIVIRGQMAEIQLRHSRILKNNLKQYLERERGLIEKIAKHEIVSEYLGIVPDLEQELIPVTNKYMTENISDENASQVYRILAAIPPIFALAGTAFQFFFQGRPISTENLLALFGAYGVAKVFTKLDQGLFKEEWGRVMDEWYAVYQQPRILKTLRRLLIPNRLESPSLTDSEEDLVEDAINALNSLR